MSRRPLVVLQSFGAIRRTTNPYLTQLVASLPDGVTWLPFRWRTALFGRFDVFHVHWPEIVFLREGRLNTLGRMLLLRLVLARIRLQRIAVVRTVHNVRPHTSLSRLAQRTIAALDRATAVWIRLNPHTPLPAGAPHVDIPLGDYREWVGDRRVPPSRPGRLLFFGLVREYKNVERLVTEFRNLPDADLSLHVVGAVDPPSLGSRIADAARQDERVTTQLRYLEDDELVGELGSSELVVLPYRELHNSSAALHALSLARPVLVPATDSTDALADEVGERWVQRYSGELAAHHLTDALRAVRATDGGDGPDLERRRWPVLGEAHARAYAFAVRVARRRGAQADLAYSE